MMPFNSVEPKAYQIPGTKYSPNSERPVLHYPNALININLEELVAAMERRGWLKGGHWKIASVPDAATPHYHSTTHECYTVLRGRGVYCLGKSPLDGDEDGVRFEVGEGDVFAFPAGVTHNVVHTEAEYEIVGYFALHVDVAQSGQNSLEEPYDMNFARESVEVTMKMREKCKLVRTPEQDPVHGPDGPMKTLWTIE